MMPPQSGFCSHCGTDYPPAARFCRTCGRGLSNPFPLRSLNRLPWLIGGGALAGLLVLLLLMMVRGARTATSPGMGSLSSPGETQAVAPDISRMTPRERFDRLYNRVMQAAQSGDTATRKRFMPMALGAYEMLDTIDADARFHAALLQVHAGDVERAEAIGDTILTQHPGHLLGYVVLATVARWRRDQRALRQVYSDFMVHYDDEMRANRPEYREHSFSIDELRRGAAQGGSSRAVEP
jgi:hypothetical protein